MEFKSYLDQNYETLKKNCLLNKQLFEDDKFPANETSIWQKNKIECKNICWKRPHEFLKNPKFIVKNIESSDLNQGQLGDCWFISAAVSISTIPEYVKRIIPLDQSFNKSTYAGIFHFRFWRFGQWIDVVVDDRLPVDYNNNLIYSINQIDKNEMFSCLLEKAYAKLNKCYEFLIGGHVIDAMIDMTGGVHETFKFRQLLNQDNSLETNKLIKNLWNCLFKCFKGNSIAGAVIKPSSTEKDVKTREKKLIIGHTYCILEPIEIIFDNNQYSRLRVNIDENIKIKKSVKLLKIKNPWGDDSWTGEWSQSCSKWKLIHQNLKKMLFKDFKTNGLFYMKFEDFLNYFDELYLVHTNLNMFDLISKKNPPSQSLKWDLNEFNGSWSIENNSNGGCGNEDRKSYWNNPKYLINVSNNNQSLIISLIQTDQIKKRIEIDGSYENSNEPIAFALYRIEDIKLDQIYNDDNCSKLCSTGTYIYRREATKFITLNKGKYLLIPSLFDKENESNYYLRIFAQKSLKNSIKITDLNAPYDKNKFLRDSGLSLDQSSIINQISEVSELSLDSGLSLCESSLCESTFFNVSVHKQLLEESNEIKEEIKSIVSTNQIVIKSNLKNTSKTCAIL